jgi:hypothetical protein
MHLHRSPPSSECRSDGVVVFGLDNINRKGERLPGAPAPKRYATIGRVQELLRLSGTRVVQLRNNDPRFPAPAVEIYEQRLVRAAWREADITAYKRGKESASAGDPEQYIGYSAIGELLGVTAERVRQLERKDPRFPPVAVELVGASTRRTSRQVIHKGWRRDEIDAYVSARSSR